MIWLVSLLITIITMIIIIFPGKCNYDGYSNIPDYAMESHGKIVSNSEFNGKDASRIYPSEVLLTSREGESVPFDIDIQQCISGSPTAWLKRRLVGNGLYLDDSNTFRCQLTGNEYIPCKVESSDRQFIVDNTIGYRWHTRDALNEHKEDGNGWILYNNAFYDLSTYVNYTLEETAIDGNVANITKTVSSSLAYLGKDFTDFLRSSLGKEITSDEFNNAGGSSKMETCFLKLFYTGNLLNTENVQLRCIDKYSAFLFWFAAISATVLTLMLLTSFHRPPKAKGSFPFTLVYINFENYLNFEKIVQSIRDSEIPHNQILLCISVPPTMTDKVLKYLQYSKTYSVERQKTCLYADRSHILPYCIVSTNMSKRLVMACWMSLVNHLRTGHDIEAQVSELALELYDTLYYELQIDPARYEGIVISEPYLFAPRALRDMAKALTDSKYGGCAGRVIPVAYGPNRAFAWLMNSHLISNMKSALNIGVWTGFMGLRLDKSHLFIKHLLLPNYNKTLQFIFNNEYDASIGVLMQLYLGKIRYLPSSIAFHHLPSNPFNIWKAQLNGSILSLICSIYSFRRLQNIWTVFYLLYLLAKPVVLICFFGCFLVGIMAFLASPNAYAIVGTSMIIYCFTAIGIHGCRGHVNLMQNYIIYITILPLYMIAHFASLLSLKTNVRSMANDIEMTFKRSSREIPEMDIGDAKTIIDKTVVMDKTELMDKTVLMDHAILMANELAEKDIDLEELNTAEELTGLMRTDVKDEIAFILDQNKEAEVKETLRNEFGDELVRLFDRWIDLCILEYDNEQ
eukprot:NODE_454_length_8261_cov_0.201054.p1 type:complete len:797 gc:universal NODE_454_length_8261_cov_0.201054:1292-3682(+)